ncbi:MAG: GNAT family N-acetyltransferase [Clostridia bacterium]|nr:GNAT family N-acetyltransferase [Clostridia bacterium]
MTTIIPYEPKYKEDVRFVCLNSEGPCADPPEVQNFVITTYCDYYIEREPENCFVAVNEEDRAVAYIICAESFDRFESVFYGTYASRLKGQKHVYKASMHSADPQRKFKSEYPAHLHIDVLPQYQRQGLGHKLVDRLAEHLRAKRVPGVMLTVGSQNQVGQSFYRKYGFTQLEETPGDVAFGLKL